MLTCFKNAGFKLKLSKCHWCKSSITFLGHVITPAGILPNTEKIKSVLKVKELKNVAEVQAFLGLTSYFRRLIRNYSTIPAPGEAQDGRRVLAV